MLHLKRFQLKQNEWIKSQSPIRIDETIRVDYKMDQNDTNSSVRIRRSSSYTSQSYRLVGIVNHIGKIVAIV